MIVKIYQQIKSLNNIKKSGLNAKVCHVHIQKFDVFFIIELERERERERETIVTFKT